MPEDKEPPSTSTLRHRLTRKQILVLPAILFTFGILEYCLITYLTDSVAAARRMAAAFSTFFYILLWYVVGREVILGSPHIALVYAFGCAVGTFITCRDERGESAVDRLLRRLRGGAA